MSLKDHFTPSSLSLSSDDWDRSEGEIDLSRVNGQANPASRNSVAFPGDGVKDTPGLRTLGGGKEGRTLSELMRLRAEKGTDVTFSAEEASRVADVLKQWINSGMSPYEDEDKFFSRSEDDSLLESRQPSRLQMEINGRPGPCGQSEVLMTARPR